MDEGALEAAARAIRSAGTVGALTGAGLSTASGIPDFRGPDGLWNRYDPDDFHIRRFRSDPADYWEHQLELYEAAFAEHEPEPNPAHDALADLEHRGHLDTVVTQNIDGLHQEAGSEDVVELHGSTARVVCRSCQHRFDAAPVRERAADGELPPTCAECDGVLKPDTVLFGEQLPEHALTRGRALAQRAEVFLALGSSLTVEPAASLPATAADYGATTIVVNLEPTPLSDRADADIRADVTEALPTIRDLVRDR